MLKPHDVLAMIQEYEVKVVDLRFTDINGKEHHVSFPAKCIDEDIFEEGKPFDGSSLAGWKGIDASDMILKPDPKTARIDPFYDEVTLVMTCDIIEPDTGLGYRRDPRSIAHRAENYLKTTGIADQAFFGPEPEFHVFDGVSWNTDPENSFFRVSSNEAGWASKNDPMTNLGHRPGHQGGYFPVPPIDSFQNLRTEICALLEAQGVPVELHHHEVGAGQCEIGTRFNTLVTRADWTQILKYTVWNTAQSFGKTATFMPKPITGSAGSGMHVHQSLWKNGTNLFAGTGYAGLSETALFYIGGIIKHAKALNAITNPTTNSYKRLVPGFEAPVKLAYSSRNRSAAIRIPLASSDNARRVEIRFPDPTANPYLAFSALLMAGLDGILNKIHPGEATDKNLYDLPPEESANVPMICASLEEALQGLACDYQFLTAGGVFDEDFLQAYIGLKSREIERFRMSTAPIEFEMYYKL